LSSTSATTSVAELGRKAAARLDRILHLADGAHGGGKAGWRDDGRRQGWVNGVPGSGEAG